MEPVYELIDSYIDRKLLIMQKIEQLKAQLDDDVMKDDLLPLIDEYREVDARIARLCERLENM